MRPRFYAWLGRRCHILWFPSPGWRGVRGEVLRGLLERSGQSEFLAHFPDRGQHFLFHQLETAHGILMADGAVVRPYAENPRTKYLQALTNLLENSVGTSDYYAIAFDHRIPARVELHPYLGSTVSL